jgi:hypothetical protein
MDRKFGIKGRFALWALATAVGAAAPMYVPTQVQAADEEMKDVAESKVPPAVLQTARQEALESRDVVYRRHVNGKTFVVNFTTPQNIRLQAHIREDGQLEEEAKLAPKQPEGAPAREQREQLLAQWNQRVIQARTGVAGVGQPPVAIPQNIPALPGDLPPLPVQPVNTPVAAADLPGAVVQSLDRFTAGGRDVRYFRQQSTDSRINRYEADYTGADGTRREVIIADNGSLIAGPLVLRETAEPNDLAADHPENQQPAQTQPIEARDVPARALAVMNRYTQGATDLRYRRDTNADRTTTYTAHWVLADTGRRYYMTTREDGSLLVQPRLSSVQPATTTDAEGVRSAPVARENIPDRVRQALEQTAGRDRNAHYYRQVREGNKVYYGAEYTDNGKLMWIRMDDTGRVVAGPVLASTGQAPGRENPREAAPVGRAPDNNRPEMRDVPSAVQTAVRSHTEGGRDVVTTRQTEGGRTVYHVSWQDAKGNRHEMRLDERGEVVQNVPAKK